MGFNEADKTTLLKVLQGRKCLSCGNLKLILQDGYVALSLQPETGGVTLTRNTFHVVALSCPECGFTSLWKVEKPPRKKAEVG